ncbi:DUF1499 domain-containing protein [Desulfocicer niacini]
MKITQWIFRMTGLLMICMGCKTPEIGLTPAGLRPCPDRPNCVSSQENNDEHKILPLTYSTDKETAYAKIKKIISHQKNAHIVAENADYIHVTFKSKIMGFMDDMEFWFPRDQQLIHLRSASRVGYSDFGVNKKRVETIRNLFTE